MLEKPKNYKNNKRCVPKKLLMRLKIIINIISLYSKILDSENFSKVIVLLGFYFLYFNIYNTIAGSSGHAFSSSIYNYSLLSALDKYAQVFTREFLFEITYAFILFNLIIVGEYFLIRSMRSIIEFPVLDIANIK